MNKCVHVGIFIFKALSSKPKQKFLRRFILNVPTFCILYTTEHSDSNEIAQLHFAVVITLYMYLNADVVVILASYTLVMMTNLAAFYSL